MQPNDPKALAAKRFATTAGITALDIILEHATDVPVALEILRDECRPRGDNWRFCELGFGSGWMLDEMARAYPDLGELHGLDMSTAFARHVAAAHPEARIVLGDIERLPFADASFDCIATLWTLYFMRDIDAALAEIKRVLRPGGKLVAATVAPDHMREIDELTSAVLAGHEPQSIDAVADRFDLASGRPYIERAFPDAVLREYAGEMVLDVDTLVRFWDLMHQEYAADPRLPAMLANVRTEAERIADATGRVRITRHDGVFVGKA